ncbi:MAG: dihydrolipoyl dehydrogenase [Eubacterium sp.]
MSEEKKNVLVIGGGPGGYIAAIRASQLGAEVTVVEKDKLGGTCLNVGCIPTKCLLHSAEVFTEVKNCKTQGIKVSEVALDFPAVIKQKTRISRKLVAGVKSLLRDNGVKVITGSARFTVPKKIEVTEKDGSVTEMTPDDIILAAGSVNVVPPIPGLQDNPACIDSTGALSLKSLPESMIVIGGGVVGLELACAYAQFGTRITVVEALDHVLPMLDGEISEFAVAQMKKMGMKFHLECPVEEVRSAEDGTAEVICLNKQTGQKESFKAEKVLTAIGRKANVDSLELEKSGIRYDKGGIEVDDYMQTNVPGIYAIGDCVKGRTRLAHTASVMGEIAAENIMDQKQLYDEKTNVTCVYVEPEAAAVGLTEEQCRARDLDYKVGRFPLVANGKSVIINGGVGTVKIIADADTEKILGVHMIGPRASDLIAEGALAIRMGTTVDELISTIHSHPTVSESVREAALDLQGRVLNMPPESARKKKK